MLSDFETVIFLFLHTTDSVRDVFEFTIQIKRKYDFSICQNKRKMIKRKYNISMCEINEKCILF